MEQREKEESVGYDEEKWVYDSSLDYKGRVPLRATTGVWKASLFIIANEFSERLIHFGIATSLILYLTTALNQDLKTAARNANYWTGVTTIMPLLGGFLADAYLGRFSTVLASSIVYLLSARILLGTPFYRYRMPTRSPLTPMVQVVVAAFSKRNLACPSNPSQLYEVPKSQKTEGRLLLHTDKLK
ncbi:hypothetical protein C3L33_12519, partial [Rhododendron williamsianum]